MPRTPAPLTVLEDHDQWLVLHDGIIVIAEFAEEADARAFVALPALEDLLKDYREEHRQDGCERFEQESVGDNAIIEVVDHRCGYCCLADKLLAALAQADGPKEQP
jgi:hypothetical protein